MEVMFAVHLPEHIQLVLNIARTCVQELLSNLEEALRPVSEHTHGPGKAEVLRVADAKDTEAPAASAATKEADKGDAPSVTAAPSDSQEQEINAGEAASTSPADDTAAEPEKPLGEEGAPPAVCDDVDRGSSNQRESGEPGSVADVGGAADSNGALPELYRGTIGLDAAQCTHSLSFPKWFCHCCIDMTGLCPFRLICRELTAS